MTEIHQNFPGSHHPVDDATRHSDDRNKGDGAHGRQILDDSSRDSILATVNISFNAHMRLRAYQDQKIQLPADSEIAVNGLPASVDSQPGIVSEQSSNVIENSPVESSTALKNPDAAGFSEHMMNILSEVENNIVQTSEPGYQYLVNMLNNYKMTVEDPQQLQEIMRKEEFYLSRRKPFMDSADFQSYSQVLNQFSNIVERQQYFS